MFNLEVSHAEPVVSKICAHFQRAGLGSMSMTHSVYMFTHKKPVYYNVRYERKNG